MGETGQHSDEELVLQFKAGDDAAFGALLGKYKKSVVNIAYRFLRNREDAEDIAQEVFIRVYQAADRYRPEAKFSTYLYRITANLCLNELRRPGRRNSVSLDAPEDGAGDRDRLTDLPGNASGTPRVILSRKEDETAVRKAIDSLQPEQKLAVILSEYEGLSYSEIAQTLRCSVKAVERRLYRARAALREKLSSLR